MTFRQVRGFFEYWKDSPPESEVLAILARAYTTWRPASSRLSSEEEHLRSLEERWNAGAMNAKKLFESMGGATAVAVRIDGTRQPAQLSRSLPGTH